MATQDGLHREAQREVIRSEGQIDNGRWTRLAHWASPLALFCALLLAASPAEARKKKKKAEPATTTAPAESPPPAEEPAKKPAAAPEAKAEAEEPIEGPSLAVVGVALDPQGDRDAALAAYLAEQAVRRTRKQKLVSVEDVLDPDGAAAREKAGVEGDRDLKTAKRAYFQDLDLDAAAAFCDRAYAAYLKSDVIKNFSKLVEASELKAAAYAADPKKADLVKAEFGLLLPVDPRTELSPNLFNPDVIKMAEGVRQQLKENANLSLQVKSGSVPARVFVDGLFRGIAPTSVDHLAPGPHFVTLVAPGYVRAQKKVNPGPEPTLDITMERAPRAASIQPKLDAVKRAFRSEQLQTAAADAARALGADQLLVVAPQPGPKPGSRELAAVRVATGPPSILDDLDAPLPADQAKRDAAIDALATDAITRDHLLKGHRLLLASGGGHSGMKYAGYGLIGGGVVAAGLGTFFGLQAKSQENNFKGLAQTDPSASSVASSGKTDALIANVAFGAAAVAVGTGVALAVMGSRGGGEPAEAEEPAREPAPRPSSEVKREEKKRAPELKAESKKAESAKPPPEPKPEAKKPEVAKPPPEKKAEPQQTPPEQAKPEATKPPEKKQEEETPPPPKVEKKKAEPAPSDEGEKKKPNDLGEDIKDD